MVARFKVDSCFRPCKPNPQARIRLFCFPYAGGGPYTYRNWPDRLPASVEVLAAQFPGRGSRLFEPPFTDLAQFVEESSRSLLQYSDKPFAFFGHSMGALVSFKVACHLRENNRPLPHHLFLSGRAGPRNLQGKLRISRLSDADFILELSRLGGTPKAVLENTELMTMMLPSVRADFVACESYIHTMESPLPCPISVFAGMEDAEFTQEQLEEWHTETAGSFSLKSFPGDHFYLEMEQQLLFDTIANSLTAVE